MTEIQKINNMIIRNPNQKYTFCIVITGTYYRKTWLKIAQELIKKGHKIKCITTSYIVSKQAKKNTIDTININDIYEDYVKCYTDDKFIKIILEMGSSDEDFFLTREKYIYGAKPKEIRKHVYAYYNFFNDYFQKNKIDFLLYNGDDTLNLVSEKVAQRQGILTLHTNCVGIISNTINWDTSMYHNSWVKSEYITQKMTNKEYENVKEYILKVTRERPMIGINTRPILSFDFAKKYLTLLIHYLANGQCRHDYWNPFLRFKYWMSRIPNLRREKNLYSDPNYDENYIFFPLHVYNDAQTTIRAVEFFNQNKLAETISKELPKGLKLYIKQHPHGAGLEPVEWIRNISNLSNVKLLNPDVNSHDIIKNGKAIITINSDVGWEGILYGKPVIVLDAPFYYDMGITIDITNLQNLNKKIKEAILTNIDKSRVQKVVHAVLKSHHPGSFFKTGTVDFNYDQKNILKITDSLIKEINYRLKNN